MTAIPRGQSIVHLKFYGKGLMSSLYIIAPYGNVE